MKSQRLQKKQGDKILNDIKEAINGRWKTGYDVPRLLKPEVLEQIYEDSLISLLQEES